MHLFREMVLTMLVAVAIFFVLQLTIQSSVVVGSSMEPSLQSGQRLVVSKSSYILHQPARGDVVIFYAPNSHNTEFIKRVIGLPGDTVEVKDGKVIINGQAIKETYIANPPRYTYSRETVPENQYFVLGDNRNNSNDSHNGWTVPRQSIIGKGWLSIWPPGDWGLIHTYPQP